MSNRIRSTAKAGVALALSAGLLTAIAMPAQAGDGGAFAAGLIGGTALGTLFGVAVSHPPPPPPPPPGYYPPPPAVYDPASAGGPPPGPAPRCARWRATPAPDGSPVCLRYFND